MSAKQRKIVAQVGENTHGDAMVEKIALDVHLHYSITRKAFVDMLMMDCTKSIFTKCVEKMISKYISLSKACYVGKYFLTIATGVVYILCA